MDMKVNTNTGIQQEPASRAEEIKHPEQAAASAAGNVSSAKAALEVQAGQVAGTAEAGKAAAAPARHPACDQYIPQKPEDSVSYGHYQPVSDGEGNTRIQFNAPPQESAADQDGGTSASTAAPETAAGRQPVQDRYVPEKKLNQEKASASGGRQNVQVLEMRKKRLEQQVRSTGDSEERKSLKQKLEQIKRSLKAAQR